MRRLLGLTLILTALLTMGISGGFALGRSHEPFAPWILFRSVRGHDMYRMRSDGSEVQNLPINIIDIGGLSLSPDGHWFVYQSDVREPWEIYRMRADGSEVQNLSQNPAED